MLYETLDAILSLTVSSHLMSSVGSCKEFAKKKIVSKVSQIRSHIFPSNRVSVPAFSCQVVFNNFEQMSSYHLAKLVNNIKPSGCPADAIHPHLFIDAFTALAPSVLQIINCS